MPAPKDNAPATTESGNGVIRSAQLTAKFHAYMVDRATNVDRSDRNEEIKARQAESILTAETEDEIWDADSGGTIQCRDVPGLMVRIRSFEPIVSSRQDLDNVHGYYISMDAVVLGGPAEVLNHAGLSIGQEIVLQTGADLLIFKLRAMEAKGMLPVSTVLQGTTTQSGNTVLKWARMPRMAQSGTVS